MNQTWENGSKKPNFGPDFGSFGPPKFFVGFYV